MKDQGEEGGVPILRRRTLHTRHSKPWTENRNVWRSGKGGMHVGSHVNNNIKDVRIAVSIFLAQMIPEVSV